MLALVVMDAVERINPEGDTTLVLIEEMHRRGHTVEICEPGELELERGEAAAVVSTVAGVDRDAFPCIKREGARWRPLADYDAIWMRKDPPFDQEFYYYTLILEQARGKTFLINDPRGLRDANEKLYALHFARHTPRVLVASSREKLLEFLDEIGGVGVIKPLDGAGGQGVMRLAKDDLNARAIIENLTHEGRIAAMLQEYLPAVRKGDKRVLLLDGRVLGGINRSTLYYRLRKHGLEHLLPTKPQGEGGV